LASLGTTIWYETNNKLFCESCKWHEINPNEVKNIFNRQITSLISLVNF
jgi:hypothetical protein